MNNNWMSKPRSRREALQSFLSVGGVASGGLMLGACAPPTDSGSPEPAGPRREPVDFSDPVQSLRSFIKLTGDLDPTVETPGWFGGTVFGDTRRDRPMKPLFGVEGFGVVRTEAQPDGSFKVFNRELAFYKDLKTGEFIDKWTNPYTKEEVDVMPIHNMTVNANLIVSEKVGTAIEMDFDGNLMEVPLPLGWHEFGDKLFSNFEVHTMFPNELKPEEWPRESAGKILQDCRDISTRVANLAEVENPDTTSTDYSGTWTRVGPWLPWMLMGQAEGNLFFRTFMTKLNSIDQIPRPVERRLLRSGLPEYFVAPAAGDLGWQERFQLQCVRQGKRAETAT